MTYRKTIAGMALVMDRRELVPGVPIFMISMQGDPVKFPMVYKKDHGGWIFVDKMTFLEFKQIEKEISNALEQLGKD